MTYVAPEIHELGLTEEVIMGVTGEGSDLIDKYPPALALEDFDE
jgi:hypothetical protein